MLNSKRVIKFFVCWWLAVCVCFVVSFAGEGKAQESGKIEVISQVPSEKNVGGKNRQNQQESRRRERVNKGEEKDEDLTTLPLNGGKPVEVSVAVHITNFAAIDEAKENYEVVGYLDASWKDDRLAFDAKNEGQKRRFYDLEEVWHPYLEFVNRVGKEEMANVGICAYPNGMVDFSEGFNITLSSDFDFKSFPFDSQKLKMAIESFRYNATEVVFIAEPKSDISQDNFVGLSEWKIKQLTTNVVNKVVNADGNKAYSRFVGELKIVRNYQFYLGKVFIPMFLIVVISGACFWIDIKYFDVLTAIGLTNLLTAIAFSLSIAGSLPKVSYLTFMDSFITVSYVFIFLTIIEIIWVHYLSQKGEKELAENAHRKGRWIFPAGFVLANLFLGLFLLFPF